MHANGQVIHDPVHSVLLFDGIGEHTHLLGTQIPGTEHPAGLGNPESQLVIGSFDPIALQDFAEVFRASEHLRVAVGQRIVVVRDLSAGRRDLVNIQLHLQCTKREEKSVRKAKKENTKGKTYSFAVREVVRSDSWQIGGAPHTKRASGQH